MQIKAIQKKADLQIEEINTYISENSEVADRYSEKVFEATKSIDDSMQDLHEFIQSSPEHLVVSEFQEIMVKIDSALKQDFDKVPVTVFNQVVYQRGKFKSILK